MRGFVGVWRGRDASVLEGGRKEDRERRVEQQTRGSPVKLRGYDLNPVRHGVGEAGD